MIGLAYGVHLLSSEFKSYKDASPIALPATNKWVRQGSVL